MDQKQKLNYVSSQGTLHSSSMIQAPMILHDDLDMSQTSDMGSHLVTADKQHLTITKGDTSTQLNSSMLQSGLQNSFFDFSLSHPSAQLSRQETTEIERQNINIRVEYGESIELYSRMLEEVYETGNCLVKHKITPALRARMIDWMIEVLTNFKCDD